MNCNRVTLVISSLRAGGAERVLSIMANYWVRSGKVVNVICLQNTDAQPFYHLDEGVEYRALGLLGESSSTVTAIWNNARRLFEIRRALRRTRPDVVVSFLSETNVLVLVASRFLDTRVLVTEHTDPKRWPIVPVWSLMRTITYRWADRIVVLNELGRRFFSKYGHVEVVPNPVEDCFTGLVTDEQQEREKTIVSMGRLGPEKGFDILIRAFAKLGSRIGEWRLVIIGEGIEYSRLEQLAVSLRVRANVCLAGLTREPRRRLRRAGIFVLSSRYEGFPMSLCEAMACGAPVIATEYHGGIHDLVRSGENGLIVPPEDSDALADGMRILIDDAAMRKRLGKEARGIINRFGVEVVMARWNDLVESMNSTGG